MSFDARGFDIVRYCTNVVLSYTCRRSLLLLCDKSVSELRPLFCVVGVPRRGGAVENRALNRKAWAHASISIVLEIIVRDRYCSI